MHLPSFLHHRRVKIEEKELAQTITFTDGLPISTKGFPPHRMHVSEPIISLSWLVLCFFIRLESVFCISIILTRIILTQLFQLSGRWRNSLFEFMVLSFIAYLLIHLFEYYHNYQHHCQINSQVLKQFAHDHKGIPILVDKPIEDIELGTMLYLTKGEQAPADLLVLSSEQKLFSVNSSKVNGRLTEQPKHMLHLLQKRVVSDRSGIQTSELMRLISGHVNLIARENWSSQKVGILSLKNDPLPQIFGLRSVIEQGSTVMFSEWVAGVTISMRQKWPTEMKVGRSRIEKMILKLMVISQLFSCLLGFIFLIVSNQYNFNLQETVLQILTFFEYVPLNVIIAFDLIRIIFIQRMALVPQEQRPFYFCPFDPSHASLATHLILPLNSIPAHISVDTLSMDDKGQRFSIRLNDRYEIPSDVENKSISSRSRRRRMSSLIIPTDCRENSTIRNQGLSNLLISTLLSCEMITKLKTKNEQLFEETLYEQDRVILRMASSMGMDLLCSFRRKQLTFYVVDQENIEQKSRCINKYESSKCILDDHSRKICKVINGDNQDCHLFCREVLPHSHPYAEEILQEGLIPILISKLTLPNEIISTQTRSVLFPSFLDTQHFEEIGVICLSHDLDCPRDLLKAIQENDLKPILLSNETISQAIGSTSRLGLTPTSHYMILSKGDDFGQEIRRTMLAVKRYFPEENVDCFSRHKFMLVINRQAFLTALSRLSVLNNLLVLFQLAEVILCVGFEGDDKAKLVELIEGDKMEGICLAIQDSQEDLKMDPVCSVSTRKAYGLTTVHDKSSTHVIFQIGMHFFELLTYSVLRGFRTNYAIIVGDMGCRLLSISSGFNREFLNPAMRIALLMGTFLWGLSWSFMDYDFHNKYSHWRQRHIKKRVSHLLKHHLLESLFPGIWDGLCFIGLVGLMMATFNVRIYSLHLFWWMFIMLSLKLINQTRRKILYFISTIVYSFFVVSITIFLDGPLISIHPIYIQALFEAASLQYFTIFLIITSLLLINPFDWMITSRPFLHHNPYINLDEQHDKLPHKELESLVYRIYQDQPISRTLADAFGIGQNSHATGGAMQLVADYNDEISFSNFFHKRILWTWATQLLRFLAASVFFFIQLRSLLSPQLISGLTIFTVVGSILLVLAFAYPLQTYHLFLGLSALILGTTICLRALFPSELTVFSCSMLVILSTLHSTCLQILLSSIFNLLPVVGVIVLVSVSEFTLMTVIFNQQMIALWLLLMQKELEWIAVTNLLYSQFASNSAELSQTGDILNVLMPRVVRDKLSTGQSGINLEQGNLAILFCDIDQFDRLVNQQGQAIIEILDDLFRQFDQLTLRIGMQKIETVGKTYMASSQLISSGEETRPDSNRQLVMQAIELSQMMLSYVDFKKVSTGISLHLRIGVHFGMAVAGVIGHHKPQFSLIGDTINSTSRICSNAQVDKVYISQRCVEQMAHDRELYKMTEKSINAKGKGTMLIYAIEQKLVTRRLNRKRGGESIISSEQSLKDIKSVKQLAAILHEKPLIPSLQPVFLDETASWSQLHHLEKNLFETASVELPLHQTVQLGYSLLPDNDSVNDNMNDPVYQEQVQMGRLESKICDYQKVYNHCMGVVRRSWLGFETMLVGFLYLSCPLLLITNQLPLAVQIILIIILILTILSLAITHPSLTCITRFYNLLQQLLLSSAVLILRIQGDYQRAGLLAIPVLAIALTELGETGFCLWLGSVVLAVLASVAVREYLGVGVCVVLLCQKIMRLRVVNDMLGGIVETSQQKVKIENLSKYLLPSHIMLKFYHNPDSKQHFTEECHEVTVLFADIAGFTKYSSSVQPLQVVSMLKALFTEFDKAAFKHEVYKLYTIGDCYVAMGMIEAENRRPQEEARNIVMFGLEMIDIIEKVRKQNFEQLNMRIGAHTGTVIGGVIGTDIIRYDIYGRDVAIANKMESKGKEGSMMITEETKKLLSHEVFDFEPGTLVDIEEGTAIQGHFVKVHHFPQ